MKIAMSSLEAKRIADAYLQRNTLMRKSNLWMSGIVIVPINSSIKQQTTSTGSWISILRLILSSTTSRLRL